jgi:hypothetical protein
MYFVNGYPHEAFLPNATKADILAWVKFRAEPATTSISTEDFGTLREMDELQGGNLVVFSGSEADFEFVDDAAEDHRKNTVFLRVDDETPSRLDRYFGKEVFSSFEGPWTYDALGQWMGESWAQVKAKAATKADEL